MMRDLSTKQLFKNPIAHRGLHNVSVNHIENTATAFQAAIEKGYAIECDVRLSADNHVVVFHDDTLDRLTNSSGYVHQYTLTELKNVSFKNSRDKIQSLRELLLQINGIVPLIIELKSRSNNDTGIVQNVAIELGTYVGAAATMSFDPQLLAAAQKFLPWLPNGIVSENYLTKTNTEELSWAQRLNLSWFLHWPKSRPDFISYNIKDFPSLPISILKRITRIPVISWTVKSTDQAKLSYKFCDQITFEGFDPE